MADKKALHRVFVHIVSWNSESHITNCVESVLLQEGFAVGDNLAIHVTDNASHDGTKRHLQELLGRGVTVTLNDANLGFCAAHNQGVHRAVVGSFDSILVLNPDVVLAPSALREMVDGFSRDRDIATVTPKLLRANDDLSPMVPPVIDAAGMELHESLRHFDRGSGAKDEGQYDTERFVFGGTGACILILLPCAWSVSLPYSPSKDVLAKLYPELDLASASPRIQLFDEAFFAYREDADLAWRLRNLGWRCLYRPSALAYHVRVVVPERRSTLPSILNALSVRNRFLLQFNNWSPSLGLPVFVKGIVLRNVIVVMGVLLMEQSSIPSLIQAFRLLPRSIRHRRTLRMRKKEVLGRKPAKGIAQLNEDVSAP